MFAQIPYLEWAKRFYGKVRFDLATSGVPAPPVMSPEEPQNAPVIRGTVSLREAIARYNRVPVGEAVAALGTTHALWLAYTSLLERGDEVLIEAPAYAPLVCIAEGLGARVARFERRANTGYELDPERVAAAMTPDTRAIVVTNLHNPSGRRCSREAMQTVARLAEARGATLVVDEVYAPFDDLVDPDGTFASTARVLAPNIVTVSSLTKCYGLGAERIGWLLAPSALAARAESAITATTGALPESHAVQGCRAFRNIQSLAARARNIVSGKRALVGQWAVSRGYSWSAPTEGLFGFATIPGRTDLFAQIEAGARKYEVLVAPGAFFGVPDGFRIAWSLPVDQLIQGLDRLAKALD